MEKTQVFGRVFNNYFNRNKEGKISVKELTQHVHVTVADEDMSLHDLQTAIVSMDSDGDGMLCLDDFVRLMEEAKEDEKDNDLQKAFKMYEEEIDDQEGYNGNCITPRSLKRMLNNLGESKSMEDCRIMIAYFDLNNDGVLNFDEFKLMMS